MGAAKGFRALRSHVPAAVNQCEGPGGVSDGDRSISQETTLKVPFFANVEHGRDSVVVRTCWQQDSGGEWRSWLVPVPVL